MLRKGTDEIIKTSDAKDAESLLQEILELTVRKFRGRNAAGEHVVESC
jgi:hypothetical protein